MCRIPDEIPKFLQRKLGFGFKDFVGQWKINNVDLGYMAEVDIFIGDLLRPLRPIIDQQQNFVWFQGLGLEHQQGAEEAGEPK